MASLFGYFGDSFLFIGESRRFASVLFCLCLFFCVFSWLFTIFDCSSIVAFGTQTLRLETSYKRQGVIAHGKAGRQV